MLPADPDFRDGGVAERAAWEALRGQLPDDAVVFTGVGLQDGATEREIDLLVAWPGVGLAAIEVKGGYITRRDGRWWQGSGEAQHSIDPVHQVQDARHVLTGLLRQNGLDAAHARIAHLVALPHTPVPRTLEAPDLPRAMLVDRDDLSHIAFLVKRAIEDHGVGRAGLDAGALEALITYLTGSFPSQVDALTHAAEHEDHLDQLTRDQARLLDALRTFRRLQVVGAAGTGKTWLALEQARRRAKEGDRVALLCYSRGLARYLVRVTQTWRPAERPAFVGLFHDLPVRWGAPAGSDDDSAYWESELPAHLGRLAASRGPRDLFDAVVVDEAQDFGDDWWPPLLRCLRDPEQGRLYVFLDEAQRVFARDGVVPISVDPVVLDENLRSTKQIAQLSGSLRDGVTRPRGWDGSPVRIVDVPADDAIGAADDMVEQLLAEGWYPGQIALLATGRRHPLQVELTASGHDEYWDGFFAEDDVFYGHVLGFKGLERSAVVLAVNGFRELERARSLLYTGMSRARSLLVVVGPRGTIEGLGGERTRQRLAHAETWFAGAPPAL
ncbi:nuclease-related domain-containing DEAD/DEAH box helicase [Cellulomonas terrae]|uniref:Nuclease n=1 Tax=Cellulomonas terrae TaxID=311234 RepID=A0A511JRC3_9CELL|nr:NERD domain-containing protein/DEAD/DEAH box helicase [Cellulomonas terrae]GEM00064.1 nuclease [Cellulomonas terrae]